MAADLVLSGASVHTVDPARPKASAVAVAGGRIVAVGGDVSEHVGPSTLVLELEGRSVLPGFQDAHLHFAHGGIASVQCNLYETTTPDEHAAVIAAYAASHPDDPWIVGGGWSMDDFGGPMPTAAFLDAIVPDRPVFLETRDGHTGWVNTAALAAAGITAATPDPAGGVIDRDAGGAPSGTLQESALRLVERLLPRVGPDAWERALLAAQAELHALGITACQEARLDAELYGPYRAVAERGELTMRMEANLWWDPERGDEQLEELLARRAEGAVGRLRVRGAKLYQDGVVESYTAAMLDPYRDAGAATGTTGISLFDPERLRRAVALLDGHGFQVHIHAIGDRAVRECLDAFEHARGVNGERDARFHLAHVQFVHPDDLPRFAALGVAANMTPYWAVLSGYVEDLTLPHVSEQAAAGMYAHAALLRSGARLAFGSDWKVSTPDPLLQLEVAVDRRRPGYPADKVLLPDERLDLETAVAVATLGSAWVNGLDDVTGSVEVGKLADLVVLDRDLFDRGAGSIHEARVALTLVEGETVYDAGVIR
jgi:predicted amidohydrolase YtcJ